MTNMKDWLVKKAETFAEEVFLSELLPSGGRLEITPHFGISFLERMGYSEPDGPNYKIVILQEN